MYDIHQKNNKPPSDRDGIKTAKLRQAMSKNLVCSLTKKSISLRHVLSRSGDPIQEKLRDFLDVS